MTTLNNAIKRIKELTEAGYTTAKIRAMLTLEDYTPKEIKEAMAEANMKPKATTFASEYYTFLSAYHRTKEEAEEYIMGGGVYGETTTNVQKHLSHYLNIWELTNTIWAQKEPAPEMSEEVKAAWDKLAKGKAAYEAGNPPRKTNFHPDKISSYGDAELITAYKEFFQILNNL